MRKGISTAACAAVVISCLGGCATTSDERIESRTARVLGVAPNEVQISDRDGSLGGTTYVATVRGRRYICVIAGGGVLTYGISSAPDCNPAVD